MPFEIPHFRPYNNRDIPICYEQVMLDFMKVELVFNRIDNKNLPLPKINR